MNTSITECLYDERDRRADGGFPARDDGMSAPRCSSRWQASQMPAVRGELDAYYAGFPTNLSALEAALHEIYAHHPGWSPFRMKAAGYALMAERCPVKVFRHFPFYFEIDVSKPRTDLGSGGIGGWMRGTPFAAQLTEQGNSWHGTCGARGLSWGWPVMDDNHLCLGNDVVFQFGLNGLIQQAEARQARAGSDNEREFLDAVIAGNRALLRIAERFAAEAERMLAGEDDPAVCARLARIAETAVRVPGEPPETFYEAVNTLLFMREIVQSMEGSGISMLGHLDRILWPFYEREVARGTLTRDGAKELLACLLIFPATRFDLRANGNHVGTNISVGIGGCDADGRPVFNALTEIILEIYREQQLIDPKLHARVGRDYPAEYLLRVAELAASGQNGLAIFNDDVIIAANEKAGKALRDCRLYVGGGCQENVLENTEQNSRATIYLNLLQVLLMGFDPGQWKWFAERESVQMADAVLCATFDDFYRVFLGLLRRVVAVYVAQRNRTESEGWRYNPCPILSSTIRDCIDNARDITQGGARYNAGSVGLTGIGTLIDSLFAIREMVYRRRELTLAELRAALAADFSGCEALRAELLRLPKYGQDDAGIRDFSAKVFADLARVADGETSSRGGRYEASLFAFRSFTDFGEKTGATPDGRRAGEYLSSGMGPSLSAMTKDASIGQVLRAMEPLDLRDYPVVAVLDLKLPATPGSFPPAILVPVIQRFIAAGGSVLQMNVVNPEVLREAKTHPERHPDLAVRISGYSAYFTTLPENVQDEVINRSEANI